jgi:uncharacterized protein YkwD
MVQKHIVISMIAPVAVTGILIIAILAVTVNAQESNSTENAQQQGNNTGNAQESNNTGNATSTGVPENTTSTGGSTVNNGTGTTPVNNGTGNAQPPELPNAILAVQNAERAAVGVPPLGWSEALAADAKTYAEHLIATGPPYNHPSAEWVAAHPNSVPGYVGENLVVNGPYNGPHEPFTQEFLTKFQQFWVGEKKNYHGNTGDYNGIGHYTQMVWNTTKLVGCAIASGNGHDVLDCRYSPAGNIIGQKPY